MENFKIKKLEEENPKPLKCNSDSAFKRAARTHQSDVHYTISIP
jgi:hypothetical protein